MVIVINFFNTFAFSCFLFFLYTHYLIGDRGLEKAFLVASVVSYFSYFVLFLPSYILLLDFPVKFVKEVILSKYMPFLLLYLWLKKIKGSRHLVYVFMFLSLVTVGYGVFKLVHGNFFTVGGLKWQGAGAVTWGLTSFLILYWLRGREPPVKTIILMLAAVMFAADLYEVPWLIYVNPDIFITPKFVLSFGILAHYIVTCNPGPRINRWLFLFSGALLSIIYFLWFVRPPFFAMYMRIPSAMMVLSFFYGGEHGWK